METFDRDEVNSNNSKYVKFEIMVDDLAKYLGKYFIHIRILNPLKIIFDGDEVNTYANKLIEDSMIYNGIDDIDDIDYINIINDINIIDEIEYIKNTGIMGLKELVKECREKSMLKFSIIFWSLFIISVDENLYNKKLSTIADIAYLIGFSEEMLKDWITALKLIFEGKDFKSFSYSTDEAKQFFTQR